MLRSGDTEVLDVIREFDGSVLHPKAKKKICCAVCSENKHLLKIKINSPRYEK